MITSTQLSASRTNPALEQALLRHFKPTPEALYYCHLLAIPPKERSNADQRIIAELKNHIERLEVAA